MALKLGAFDGGTMRASLASVLGISAKQFRQFMLYADPDNTGNIFLGDVTVTSAGANRTLKIPPGISINLGPDGADRPFVVDTDALYCVGSAAAQVLFVIANTDDGR